MAEYMFGLPVKHKLRRLKDVDDSAIGDDKILVFKAASGKHMYEAKPAGGGDMYKLTYDQNDNGVVDDSEKLEGSTKAQIQDHNPKAHTHPESELSFDIVSGHKHDGVLARQMNHSELAGIGASDHHVKTTTKAEITDFTHGNESHSATFEDQANKGQASGYCELDASAKVPASKMPTAKVKTTLSFAVVGALSVGTDKAPTLLAPCTLTIVKVKLVVKTAPSGAAIIVDVNKNGATIFTTQANRPQIADGQTTGDSGTPDVTALSEGDKLTIDIDQVGSTTAGADLTIEVVCEQSVVFS